MTDWTTFFGCRSPYCAEEVSYPADMLAEHPDGGPVCEGCWESDDARYDSGEEGGPRSFSSLPRFVPQYEKDKKELVEALRELLADTQHDCGDPDCSVAKVSALVARVMGE